MNAAGIDTFWIMRVPRYALGGVMTPATRLHAADTGNTQQTGRSYGRSRWRFRAGEVETSNPRAADSAPAGGSYAATRLFAPVGTHAGRSTRPRSRHITITLNAPLCTQRTV